MAGSSQIAASSSASPSNGPVPKIRVREIEFSVVPTATRFPFRYGIAAMTEAPHWFVKSTLEVDGRIARGIASEGLPPKWFTKNPETTFEQDDLPGMQRSIRKAAASACKIGTALSFFELWKELKRRQDAWANPESVPSLLAQMGTALIERTVLDGLCRSIGLPLHQVIRENRLGIALEEIHSEFKGVDIRSVFNEPPLDALSVRHTVGLADPLTDAEIAEDDQTRDGLPHSLAANIRTYGLTHFKIKACGDLEKDRARLRAVYSVLAAEASSDFKITLDGNEQYPSIEAFREHFRAWKSDAAIAPLLDHLILIEQPIHRDLALNDSVRAGFDSWTDAPPVIIDESDAEPNSLPRALDLGYAGTSHKNCKGVVKSLANRALLNLRGGVMSAEDLANLGPVALLQDLAVVALLGIPHVERNGHHYFAGLSMFPKPIQEETLKAHPDLYQVGQLGFPALKIDQGRISTKSVNAAPFGVALDPESRFLA